MRPHGCACPVRMEWCKSCQDTGTGTGGRGGVTRSGLQVRVPRGRVAAWTPRIVTHGRSGCARVAACCGAAAGRRVSCRCGAVRRTAGGGAPPGERRTSGLQRTRAFRTRGMTALRARAVFSRIYVNHFLLRDAPRALRTTNTPLVRDPRSIAHRIHVTSAALYEGISRLAPSLLRSICWCFVLDRSGCGGRGRAARHVGAAEQLPGAPAASPRRTCRTCARRAGARRGLAEAPLRRRRPSS